MSKTLIGTPIGMERVCIGVFMGECGWMDGRVDVGEERRRGGGGDGRAVQADWDWREGRRKGGWGPG